MHIHTCAFPSTNPHIHTYRYMHIQTHTHTTYTHRWCTYAHTHTPPTHMMHATHHRDTWCTHAHTHTHTCMHTYVHALIHTHIYTHAHKHTHTHTCIILPCHCRLHFFKKLNNMTIFEQNNYLRLDYTMVKVVMVIIYHSIISNSPPLHSS